jgi:hypothetical protein
MKKPYIHLIGAFIMLLIVIGVYASWYMTVQAKIAETATLTQEIAQQTVASSRVEAAKTELKTLDGDQATIDQYFLSTNDVVPFLEQLQSTGTYLKSNVQVVSVSATPGTPTGVLDLSLKIDGTFDSVARTLGAIEYGPYDITITSLTFDTNPSSVTATTEPQWSAAATYTVGTINTPTDGNSTTTSATGRYAKQYPNCSASRDNHWCGSDSLTNTRIMKNFQDTLKKFSRTFSYGSKMHPDRDWSILVSIAAILTALSIGFNAWLFIEASTGKLAASSAAAPDHLAPAINISTVQDVFKKRATEEDAYQNTDSFVDPSTSGS